MNMASTWDKRGLVMATVGAMAMMGVVGSALAQSQTPVPLPGTPQAQIKSIDQQSKGEFSTLPKRAKLPLGAINRAWSDTCGADQTTLAVAHRLDQEITFRIRQLLGTTVVFPESVALVSGASGTAFAAKPYAPGPDQESQTWVFGATNAGIDGNFVFIGRGSASGTPTLYLLHVQAEGVNTQNCPDLVVLIKPAVSPEMHNAARAMHEWATAMRLRGGVDQALPASQTPDQGVPSAMPVKPVESVGPLTGRPTTDWLEGRGFNPSELDFRWKVYSRSGDDGKLIAPDVVYSDCCNTYLQFDQSRIDKVRIGAVHAVEQIGDGKIDAPVNWTMKGNTIVVKGVQPLTIERGGIVVCIEPNEGLYKAPARGVITQKEDEPSSDATSSPASDSRSKGWFNYEPSDVEEDDTGRS